MKFKLDEYHRNITNQELLEDLKLVADKLEKNSITVEEYERLGRFGYTTFRRRFGTWSNALQKAGLEKNINRNITEREFFDDLENVWIKLGRQPRFAEMSAPLSKYSSKTYAQRFGSWRNALEKFITYIGQTEKVSSERGAVIQTDKQGIEHKTPRSVNSRLRFMVMRRDNFKCRNCGKSPATDPNTVLHVDHIKAWANEGETVLENLQTLCSKCNIGKSDLE